MNLLDALPWWKAPRRSASAQAGLALHAATLPDSAPLATRVVSTSVQ